MRPHRRERVRVISSRFGTVAVGMLFATLVLPIQSSVAAGRAVGAGAQPSGVMGRGRSIGVPHVRQGFGNFHRRRGAFFPYVWYGYYYPVPIQTEPELPEVFDGMRKKLSENSSKRQLSRNEYAHLNQRLNDLKGKAQSMENAGGGWLDAGQEEDIRRDLKQLQDETERRSSGK